MQEPNRHPWEVERRRQERRRNIILAGVACFVIASIALVGVSFVGTSGPSAQETFELAKKAYAEERLDSAVVHLRNTLQAAPNNAPAREMLGGALLQMRDAAGAEKEFRRAISLGAIEVGDARLLEAMLLQHKYEAVVATADGELDVQQHGLVGLAQLALGRSEVARHHFTEALKVDPEHIVSRIGVIQLLAASGDLETAYAEATKLARATDAYPVWVSKGKLALATSRFAGAKEAYERGLALRDASPEARIGLATALIELQQFDAVQPILKPLVRPKIRLVNAGYLQALADFRADRLEPARGLLLELLLLEPKHVPSLSLLGLTHLRIGETALAKERLSQARAQSGNDLSIIRALANVALTSGAENEAILLFEELGTSELRDVETLLAYGQALLRTGERVRGLAAMERAAAVAPDRAEARAAMGAAKLSFGDFDQGLLDLQTAQEMVGDDTRLGVRVTTALVWGYVRKNRIDAALKLIDTVSENQPSLRHTMVNLRGFVAEVSGDVALAKSYYARAAQAGVDAGTLNGARLALRTGDFSTAHNLYSK
nr:tetratricopeptide repeat protein [Gammaproteobacteria bacterium]